MLSSQNPVHRDGEGHRFPDEHDPTEVLTRVRSLGTTVRYRGGEPINGGGDLEGCWYRVVSGAVRQCVTQPDGHRRIVDFLVAGDIFDPVWDSNQSVVEAAVDGTVIASYPRRNVERLAESDPRIGRELRDLTLTTARRLQRQILILGRGTALERVCAFLLDMEERSPGGPRNRITLPMSRYDIADYLVLAVETVSRCLTNLRARKIISFVGSRELRILDREALEECGGEPSYHGCGARSSASTGR